MKILYDTAIVSADPAARRKRKSIVLEKDEDLTFANITDSAAKYLAAH